jgi:ribose 5-phosphate isomerase B
MKIAIGSDHAGFEAKEKVREHLAKAGHEVADLGTKGLDSVDYPDFARAVAEAVAGGRAERGVLICGTGIGMSITANKVRGVRAAVVHDEFTAEVARRHNDANVVCAGARVLPAERLVSVVDVFLGSPFDGGRHERRVAKINEADRC